MTWWATDSERTDDIGYAMPKRNEPVGTQNFPVSSYSFINIVAGDGNVNVYP